MLSLKPRRDELVRITAGERVAFVRIERPCKSRYRRRVVLLTMILDDVRVQAELPIGGTAELQLDGLLVTFTCAQSATLRSSRWHNLRLGIDAPEAVAIARQGALPREGAA